MTDNLSLLSHKKQLTDITLALLPILLISAFYHGARVFLLAGCCVIAAFAADFLCRLCSSHHREGGSDLAPIAIGLILTMYLPASAPYWLAAVGGFFAVAVVRFPFGGYYNTLFHPSAVSFAFLLLSWTGICTAYPAAMAKLPLSPTVDVPVFASPAYRLMQGGADKIDLLDALLGNFIGPLGCTCTLLLLCCGVLLAIKKVILWQIPVTAISVVALFAYYFPRISTSVPLNSVKLELISGSFLFTLIFLASVDNGELTTGLGKFTYGLLFGGLTVLFRSLSQVEMVSPFVLIIMNAIDHKCDSYAAWVIAAVQKLFAGVFRLISGGFRGMGKGLAFLWNKFFEVLQRFVDPSDEKKGGKK